MALLRLLATVLVAAVGLAASMDEATAACSTQRATAFASWSPVKVPKPRNLCDFVIDERYAVLLGKAWFWDMQVGSDGLTACATCHFHAGGDRRTRNQVSPNGLLVRPPATRFEVAGPNGNLTVASFPFHKLSDPQNRGSTVLRDSDDVVGSQGVFRTQFIDIVPGQAAERVSVVRDAVFHVGNVNTRRVEPRQTMTVINAVFNIEQFWDGRGKFWFNGVSTFGLLDSEARVLRRDGDTRASPVQKVKVAIDMASLASQAVGPPLNTIEMSAVGRTFPKLGKKLLGLVPLGRQVVHPEDSVMGGFSRDDGSLTTPGLTRSYATLISRAFQPDYWDSDKLFDATGKVIGTGTPANTNQFTLMEMNTSLFWGLAIQAYLSTLVSDRSPLDRFMAGDGSALNAEERQGLAIFQTHCASCHLFPEVNSATVSHLVEQPKGDDAIIVRMAMAAGGAAARGALYDGGFYNIGVRPTAGDLGRAGVAGVVQGGKPVQKPLSFTLNAQANGEAANRIGSPRLDPPAGKGERVAVAGAFRVPSLRNAELTGPYYHNGGFATLRDVVMFYVRGGDFHERNIDTLDPEIGSAAFVNLMKGRNDLQQALAKFLARPLTDERVAFERAPFDHPELLFPDGHRGSAQAVTDDGKGQAVDNILRLAAVGRDGRAARLGRFLNLPPEQVTK